MVVEDQNEAPIMGQREAAEKAIAKAKKPFDMALAFKNAVIAGRQSFLAGRIKKTLMGNPSSPKIGII